MNFKHDFPQKFQYSIFFKVLWIIFITGILIFAIIIGFFNSFYVKEAANPFHSHLIQYVTYLTNDIGDPPDTSKINSLSASLSIHIQVLSEEKPLYASLKFPTEIDHLSDQKWWHENERFSIGEVKDHWVVVIKRGRLNYVFSPQNDRLFRPNWLFIFALIFALAFVLFLTFFGIRKILRPVKNLVYGVNEISKGNLDYTLPSHPFHKRHDEFDRISGTFNQMTLRIKEMIKSRDRLLLDVSHELRSPLTRMKVALEFLPDNSTRMNLSGDILEMETMITEILESERLKSPHGGLKLKETNIIQIIADARFAAEKPERIQLMNLPDQLILKIDPERIKMVFKNILENGLKYSSDSNLPVHVSYQIEGSFFSVKIQDYGVGIPEEELSNIFEPFYRVDKSRSKETGGFGLGMSLCKTVMEAHNGKIEIESELGKGTVVYLRFKM